MCIVCNAKAAMEVYSDSVELLAKSLADMVELVENKPFVLNPSERAALTLAKLILSGDAVALAADCHTARQEPENGLAGDFAELLTFKKAH